MKGDGMRDRHVPVYTLAFRKKGKGEEKERKRKKTTNWTLSFSKGKTRGTLYPLCYHTLAAPEKKKKGKGDEG